MPATWIRAALLTFGLTAAVAFAQRNVVLPQAYVVTDVETLNGFTIDSVVTCPYTTGTYVSGGDGDDGRAPSSGECGLDFVGTDIATADAIATTDHFYAHIGSAGLSPIVVDMGAPTASVFVFNAADHPPFPEESIEWTVWGRDSADATDFPDGWTLSTLCAIFKQGWVESGECPDDDADDFTGLYGFPAPFQFIAVHANFSITVFTDAAHTTWSTDADDDPTTDGWQSFDAEPDAVGSPMGVLPVADAGDDMTVLVGETTTLDGTGSTGTILAYSWDTDGDGVVDATGAMVDVSYGSPGDVTVTLFVVGECGCASDTKIVHVNQPPDCSGASLSSTGCWPPNHKFTLVNVLGVTDPDGDPVTVTITGITQDEPVKENSNGSGMTCPDGVLVDTNGDLNSEAAGLRCERAGNPRVPGNGRVYAVSFTASDGQGGTCSGTRTFCVVHDQRPGATCINDGQIYNSTVCPAGGASIDVDLPVVPEGRALTLEEFSALTPEPLFIRGDINWDEDLDITDGIVLLTRLFQNTDALDCSDAADVNDDSDIDISDAIGLFSYLFLGGHLPPPPTLRIGEDQTPDQFGCGT